MTAEEPGISMRVSALECANKMVQLKLRASIKGPITIPQSTFDYLTVLSMPQSFLEFL